MSIHNDSVNEVHIVLLIIHWRVSFPFVYLQNASSNCVLSFYALWRTPGSTLSYTNLTGRAYNKFHTNW